MSFKASINHSEETYKQLCKVQQQVFFKKQEILCLLIGAALILLSLSIGTSTISLIVLFVGCWFIAGMRTPPISRAKKMIDSAKGKFPHTIYHFDNTNFFFSNLYGAKKGAYEDICRLVEDKRYFYIFLKSQAGHMIDKSSLSEEDLKEFSSFLEDKTDLIFEDTRTFKSSKYALNALRASN